MNGEQKFWATLWLGIALTVCLLICTILYIDKTKGVEMAKLNYEKVMTVGNNYPVWQKVR